MAVSCVLFPGNRVEVKLSAWFTLSKSNPIFIERPEDGTGKNLEAMKTVTHVKALQEAVKALWPDKSLKIGAHAYRRMVEQAAQHQKMSALLYVK